MGRRPVVVLLFEFLCLLFVGQEVVSRPPNTFKLHQRYPNKDEIETCGNIRDIIRRNSARFRKILVRNSNNEIAFANDDCRRMSARTKSKLDVLASRVTNRWSNVKLSVALAWTDQILPTQQVSLHYEGRAVRLQTSDKDNKKLGALAGLAAESGFDWVHYASSSYIHASVIRDVCQTSVDLAFILDSSGSVGSYNFNQIKNFVKNVVDFFNIGTSGTHVAVVTYSTWSRLEFNLKAHYTKSAIKNAVGNINYRGGWTYTADSLDFVRKNIFSSSQGMRPDQGIPKVVVLLTDGYSNGRAVAGPANLLRNLGVNIFSIGVGYNVNPAELNVIASDPDSTHVFRMSSFNDLAGWVDKLSAVSCDEGASVSSCDDTTTTVESDTFKYFRTQFNTVAGNRILVEVRDIQGISHLYASQTSTNPGPMDVDSKKNESNISPRAISITLPTTKSSTLVYVAVQGQQDNNKFKLSMWDALFQRDTYTASVTEEKPSRINVLKVFSPYPYSLQYSFVEGNDQNCFTINPTTGQISTVKKLDRETRASYRLTVLVQNTQNRCHKGRTVVLVNVGDINDNAPVFGKSQYSGTVLEGKPHGTLVATVTATDKDAGTNAQLSYEITSGDGKSKFNIDNNGQVRTAQVLDFEDKQTYQLGITVQDGGSPSQTDSTTLTVTVQDQNEPPYFKSSCAHNNTCVMSVNENKSPKSPVGQLQATDPDSCNPLNYKITTEQQQTPVFAISNSGQITTLSSLDREFKAHYTAVVVVEDCGKPPLRVATRVRINVLDKNDVTPTFALTTYSASIFEDTSVNSVVLQVIASDGDVGSNGKLSYSLISGDVNAFSVDAQDGTISSRISFDRETRDSYSVTLRATDGGSVSLSGTTSINIAIMDVNDNRPKFLNAPYSTSVSEGAQVGRTVFTVDASDDDLGVNADRRYFIVKGNEQNSFSLDSKTGTLTTLRHLDYEIRQSYTLEIRVTDRGSPPLMSTTQLVVNVQDENDNSPVFTMTSYRATVRENAPKGATVSKVSATDLDSGSNKEITYAITKGNTGDIFSLDLNTGILLIENSPDFETRNQYDLQIQAADMGSPPRVTFTRVKVIIEDVNDHTPVFNQSVYSIKVSEGVAVRRAVGAVFATDQDSGPRGRVLFKITDGNVGNAFAIDGNTGILIVLSRLDRERRDSYTLTVEARDGGLPSRSSTSRVDITILDVNDNKPLFDKSGYSTHISEDAAVGNTVIKIIFAKDNDEGKNALVSYGIKSGNEQDVFLIDNNTGLITLKQVVDHEAKALYPLVVTASDHGTPPLTSSVSVMVMVDDVNDNSPQFPKSLYNCSVAENLAKGVAVCFITATDPDSGPNGRLYYSITTGNTNNAFVINTGTGEVTTHRTLDRETTRVYRLTVMAEDSKTTRSTPSLNATTSVLVYIMDENDNPPIFNRSRYTFHVREDAAKLHEVGRVTAADKDDGPNGRVSYKIGAGNLGPSFEIDQSSGAIRVISNLDREQRAQFSLTVQAKDSGKPSLTASTVVVVMIDDVNDNPPVFSQDMFYGSIREDASPGSTVLKVKASDDDSGTNGHIQLNIHGPGQDNFTIDERGFIHTATPLDYETTSHYMLTVTATDGGTPPQNASAQINITIINVNDNVPVFETSSQVSTIPEDVAVGTQVVRLNATDSDGSALKFVIASGNTGGAFAIDNGTGLITVATKLDRETTANYTLAVRAADTGGQSVVHNATVQVTDVNDNTPEFTPTSYSAVVAENLPTGQYITTVSASDRDKGVNSDISYDITTGDTSKFSINSTSGVITTSTSLDREKDSSFHLIVTARDHGTPSLSNTATVLVTVQDENDNKPSFPLPFYQASVLENTAISTTVLRVAATDPDAGENGRVTYSIATGNRDGTFVIGNATGFVSVNKTLDRETVASYSLVICASDNAQHPKLSFVRFNVSVLDENDNAPQFYDQSPNFTVVENAKSGTNVGVPSATDMDVGSNAQVVYSIVKGNDGDVFKIDSISGQITVSGAVDRETKAMYTLVVMASDKGSPVMSTEKDFYVSVSDVNDNAPEFADKVYRGSVKENSPAKTAVLQLTATDEDVGANAVITYAITAGNSQLYFIIESNTGLINTTAQIDFEKTPLFNLTVSASDPKFTTSVSVIIGVINENDNPPEFSKASYTSNVTENSLVMTPVTQVIASDVDPFGQLIYTIQPGNHSDRFSIDPTSGKITTADVLDREMIDSYVITVKVIDGGEPPLSDLATVTVHVLDANDNPPKFFGSSFSTVISEDSALSTSVIKVNATDGDVGTNAKLSYILKSGNGMYAFEIEGNTGIIRTNAKLDRENISSYVLTCEAIDHGSPQLSSTPIAVHITVADVNDNAPIFDKSFYSVNVSEDVTSGTVVEEVLAVDLDAGLNGEVVYIITAGNDDGTFAIDNTTGVVTVDQALDREIRHSYTLTITAADLGDPSKNSSVQLSITLTDVNDNKPLFNMSSLQGAILENSAAMTSVMRVMATDSDTGTNAQLVFNFTSNAYNELFSLDSNTGEIIAKKSLDRELQAQYTLKVSVRDQGTPQLSSSADVIINVIDVDDNCPRFVPAVYNITISENLPFNQSIVQVTATDVDMSDSKTMMYAIRSGNTGGAFTIDKQGYLRVSAGGVDREITDNFRLVVRAGRENCGINDTGSGGGNEAEGGSDTKLAAVAVVNIEVTDVNDNPPHFTGSSYEFDLTTVNTTEIGRVKAKDADLSTGGVVKYRLVGQTEVEGKRQVTIEAYDQGVPSLNSSINVIITTSITCEAMVFHVTEGGMITTDTLCVFTQKPSAATRLVGDTYQLSCSAKGNTQPQYRWMKDGRFLSNWEDTGDYLIEHVTDEDEGGYSCLASSAAGLIQSTVANVIVHDPPKITGHPDNSTVELGGSITLTCKASGDPQPQYLWFKDGVEMTEASGINPLLPSLVLEDAISQDQARYFCQVTNVEGTASSNWASLKVFGKEAILSMKLSVKKPNNEKTCQMFDVKEFKRVLSKALGAHVEVAGFTAPDRCEDHPCNSNPCQNRGACSKQGSGSYACLCKPGWFGNHCQLDVNECGGDPCFYNGSCMNTQGSYKCNCSSSHSGRNCELMKQACDGSPCNGSDVCVLSERSSGGFHCVTKQHVIAMTLSGQLPASRFDLENTIESLIKSAPNNANRSSTAKRGRRSNVLDYGACSVRITSYKDRLVHFVLLCPPELEAVLEPQSAQLFVCGLMFEAEQSTSCGGSEAMMTPIPPTTTPPLEPMTVTLEFFVRDSESGSDLLPEQVIDMMNKEDTGAALKQHGFKVESIQRGYTQPQKVPPSSKVGLIVGITVGLVILAIVTVAVAVFISKRRKKPLNYHFSFQQRAAGSRQDSRENILQRNVSVKDITRSEKQYLNVAYEDTGEVSDDEGQFMVQVELNKPRNNKKSMTCNEPYFYDKVTALEAEAMLSSMVKPGTFLVRQGVDSTEYMLTVRAPEGGPSFRHLPIRHAKNGPVVAQFGAMEKSMEFESINELVSHFQITPIPFDEDSPDVVLTHPWNRSEV